MLFLCFSVCLNLKADIVNPIIDPELTRFTSSLGLPFNKKIFVISGIYAKTSIEPETSSLFAYPFFGIGSFHKKIIVSDKNANHNEAKRLHIFNKTYNGPPISVDVFTAQTRAPYSY